MNYSALYSPHQLHQFAMNQIGQRSTEEQCSTLYCLLRRTFMDQIGEVLKASANTFRSFEKVKRRRVPQAG